MTKLKKHLNLNLIILCFLYLVTLSCTRRYEAEEFKAYQDITNKYLAVHDLHDLLYPPPEPGPQDFTNSRNIVPVKVDSLKLIDSLKIKVFISDALLPISQIKEDDDWMFKDSIVYKVHDSIFLSIMNTDRFKRLKYRELNKNELVLNKPYYQIFNPRKEIGTDEKYLLFNFSRICFNHDFTFGLVLIEFQRGTDSYYGIGQLKVFLIRKNQKNIWEIIEDEKNFA
jgi:hypothetical protein